MIGLRADRVRHLREEHGWSQRELARICDFGIVQIHRYEAGMSEPTATHLKTLAEKLDASADYLIGLSDDPRRREDSRELDSFDDNERDLMTAYRRDGWIGAMRLIVERMGSK